MIFCTDEWVHWVPHHVIIVNCSWKWWHKNLHAQCDSKGLSVTLFTGEFTIQSVDFRSVFTATTTIELVPTDPTGWQQQYSNPEPCHLVVPPLPSMRPPESLEYVNGASPPVPPLHKGGMPWLPPELRHIPPPSKMMCSIYIEPSNFDPHPQGG